MALRKSTCSRCGALLASDHDGLCSPCVRAQNQGPEPKPDVFWNSAAFTDALQARHFGKLMAAYRAGHTPKLKQKTLGDWCSLSQVQISRLEAAPQGPRDLNKLENWADRLFVPPRLRWFGTYTPRESQGPIDAPNVDDVDRRDLLKLGGIVAVSGVQDAPWQRLTDVLDHGRPADAATVAALEDRTATYFRSEETIPARDLITSLQKHHQDLARTAVATPGPLKTRLATTAGETAVLAAWTLFDLGRTADAERLYRNTVKSADKAGDNPLVACALGFWSYLAAARGDAASAIQMLRDASTRVRGSSAATQSWITARLAEEQAAHGDNNDALRSLDRAIAAFDYASPQTERPWTCFYGASRLGSLTVSTYGRMAHPATDSIAEDLLRSLSPLETKVGALVLADLAESAARSRDYDKAQSLTRRAAPLAVRTEASLAIDRLWETVEHLPAGSANREELIGQLTRS